MSRFEWVDLPAEIREAAEPYFLAHEWIIPAWCRVVKVEYVDKGDGRFSAESEAFPHYRFGCVRLLPSWLKLSEVERARVTMHEFVHLALWPITQFTDDLLERFAPAKDGPLAKHVRKEWAEVLEGVTEDFAWALSDFAGA